MPGQHRTGCTKRVVGPASWDTQVGRTLLIMIMLAIVLIEHSEELFVALTSVVLCPSVWYRMFCYAALWLIATIIGF